MNLLKLVQDKVTEIGNEAAAKLFKTSKSSVAKAMTGSGEFGLQAGQAILDELIEKRRIYFVEPGKGNGPKLMEAPPKREEASEAPQTDLPEKTLTATAEAAPLAELNTIDLAKVTIENAARFAPDDRIAVIEHLSAQCRSSVIVGIPTYPGQDIAPMVTLALMANTRAFKISRLMVERENTLDEARNRILNNAMEGGTEWVVLLDPDVVPPFGNPEWFDKKTGAGFGKEFAGVRTVERLTRDRDHRVIGGCYRLSGPKSVLVTDLTMTPKTEEDKATGIRIDENGPVNKLIEVNWVAPGCMAIHRSVLEQMKKTMKSDAALYPFFTPKLGDSLASAKTFGERARKLGFKVYLDCAVRCARVNRSLAV